MKQQTMGALIAARRKELGMTQLDLAEKMGVTDKAVSKWERNLSCPDVATLPKLAELFDMSVDELLRAETEQPTDVVPLIFKALCLAMGVGVVALSALKQLDPSTGVTMLGIGLTCAGLALLQERRTG